MKSPKINIFLRNHFPGILLFLALWSYLVRSSNWCLVHFSLVIFVLQIKISQFKKTAELGMQCRLGHIASVGVVLGYFWWDMLRNLLDPPKIDFLRICFLSITPFCITYFDLFWGYIIFLNFGMTCMWFSCGHRGQYFQTLYC